MTRLNDPNDPRPDDPRDGEEHAAMAALAVLDGEDPERGLEEALPAGADAGEGADAGTTLRRLYVETLGLLAWEASAEEPPEELKGRLMAAVGAGSAPAGAPAGEVVPIAGGRPGASSRRQAEPSAARRGSASRGARWLAALAAVFALAALGLAGWFYVQLDRTQDALARLEGERTRLAERLDRQEELIRRSSGMDDLLAAISTAGVEICPLRPVGDPALHPEAFAVLYMPPGSGEWYILASNLEPEQGVYKVWLNTPDGAIPVGLLGAGKDSALRFALPPEIEQDHELMLSIGVTLEPAPDASTPSGPMVLFGDDVMTVA